MSMLKDFKSFAFKGNVVDLAVGIVIGAAFARIIGAIVDAMIMPLVGKALPGGSYLAWAPGGIKVGVLIGAVIEFLIIALVLFVVVSLIKRAMAKPAVPAAPAEPTAEVKVLTEIRDLLQTRVPG